MKNNLARGFLTQSVIFAFSVFFLFSCTIVSYGQSVYHISSTGDDKNDGLSPAKAFKSIGKINALILIPGDSVLFRRGDTFRGQLNIRQSGGAGKPIVIGAYGAGAKPLLKGSVIVDKWNSKGGNVWEAVLQPGPDSVTGVYFNQSPLPLGRFPNTDAENKGYLKIQNHQGSAGFTSLQVVDKNWVGGEAVIRTNDWIIDKLPVAGQTANSFTLKSGSTYEIKNNWGYFIQDHPATLDQNGEWYYNRANKKLLIYFSGINPNNNLIEVTAFSRCINVYASNITITGIHVSGALNIGVYGRNSSNLIVTDSEISNMGEDAIVINGTGDHLTLKDNLINDVNNNGIDVTGYSDLICEANKLTDIGTKAGRGKNGNSQYIGIVYNYDGDSGTSSIKNNVLDSIGYIGIDFNSANVAVMQNVISDFDLVKNDGGGIHTYNGKNHRSRANQVIQSNIVYNGIGANAGTTDTYTGASGIYLDGGSENIKVTDNTVFNCTGAGIFLHGANHVSTAGNVSYGNNIQFMMIDDDQDGYDIQSNEITDNIFLSRNNYQVGEKLLHHHSVIAGENSFPNTVFKANSKPGQSNEGVLFEINRSGVPKIVKLNAAYKDINAHTYQDEVTLEPYSSIILFKTTR